MTQQVIDMSNADYSANIIMLDNSQEEIRNKGDIKNNFNVHLDKLKQNNTYTTKGASQYGNMQDNLITHEFQ
jgi:hypothetical protein